MRKFLATLFFSLVCSLSGVFAAPLVSEQPVTSCGATTLVTLSVTYAEITTVDLAGRTGVFVVNLATNAINVHLDIGTEAPGGAAPRMAELEAGEWDIFPVSNAMNLYARSASGTPNIYVKECKQ